MYTLPKVIKRLQTGEHWFEKSYSGFLFPIIVQATGVARAEKVSEYAIPYGFCFQNHNKFEHWDWFWDEEMMVEKRKKILAQVKKDKNFTNNFYESWEKTYNDVINYWNKIYKTEFNKLSVDEIRKVITPLYEKVAAQAAYGYVVDTFLNNEEEDWLEAEIKKELGAKSTSEVIATLTAPVHETFVNNFEAEKFKIVKKPSKALAKKVADKYFWVRTNYHVYDPVTADDVYKEALESGANHEPPSASMNRKKKLALIKKFKISENLKRILHISETFTHLQDKRKEVVLRSNILFFRALEAVEKKLKLEHKLVFYLLPEEFCNKKKFENLNWKEIKDRRDKGVIVVSCDGKCTATPEVNTRNCYPLRIFTDHSAELLK